MDDVKSNFYAHYEVLREEEFLQYKLFFLYNSKL